MRALLLALALVACDDGDYGWAPPVTREDARLCAPARYPSQCFAMLGYSWVWIPAKGAANQ